MWLRRQFLHNMFPIQLAFLRLIVWRMFLLPPLLCGEVRYFPELFIFKCKNKTFSQDLLEVLMLLIYLKKNSLLRIYSKICTIWQQRWLKVCREDLYWGTFCFLSESNYRYRRHSCSLLWGLVQVIIMFWDGMTPNFLIMRLKCYWIWGPSSSACEK
jgi:hypothetical protein